MLNNDSKSSLKIEGAISEQPDNMLDFRYLIDIEKLISENPNLDMVMDFWAEWCGSCKEFSVIFKRLHQEYGNNFIFAKVNIEQDKQIIWKYKITSIPTFMIIKNGNLAYMCTETVNYYRLKEVLDNYVRF